MILDAQLQFSDDQALTVTAVSTNSIDLLADRNIGVGEPLSVLIVPKVAGDFTTGDESYTATLQTDDNSSFSSPTTVVAATTISRPLGSPTVIAIPPNNVTERYLRLSYTLAGTSPTMTVDAFLIPTAYIQNEQYYPKGYVAR